MTLGEFRELTEQMPDDTPLKFGYADGVRNVNSFEEYDPTGYIPHRGDCFIVLRIKRLNKCE